MELKNRTLIILSVILVILLGFIIFLNTNKITSRSYELSGLSKGQTVYAYDIKDNEVIQSVYSNAPSFDSIASLWSKQVYTYSLSNNSISKTEQKYYFVANHMAKRELNSRKSSNNYNDLDLKLNNSVLTTTYTDSALTGYKTKDDIINSITKYLSKMSRESRIFVKENGNLRFEEGTL